MNKALLKALSLLTAVMLVISCKKEDDVVLDEASTQLTHARDVFKARVGVDSTLQWAQYVMRYHNQAGFSKVEPCGNFKVDSTANPVRFILTFKGKSCSGNSIRYGNITIQLTKGSDWQQAGAELTLTYKDYRDSTFIYGSQQTMTYQGLLTFNGTVTLTNVSGYQEGNSPQITYLKGPINISFDDQAARTWTFTRYITYGVSLPGANGQNRAEYSWKTTGDTTNNGLMIRGVNRFGKNFSTTVPLASPLYFYGLCLLAGQEIHSGIDHELTVIYGVDKDGNSSNSLECGVAYGCKLSWKDSEGKEVTKVVTYRELFWNR